MQKKKITIWSNYDEEFSNFKKDWIEAYEDYLFNNTLLDEEDIKAMVSDEDKVFVYYVEVNNEDLEDERENLDNKYHNRILIIGKLGLWDGVHNAYKVELNKTLGEMLYDSDCDYCRWYVDEEDEFRFEGAHHDGSNEYLYRIVNEDTTEDELSKLCACIYQGEDYSELLNEYTTKIGPELRKFYGC